MRASRHDRRFCVVLTALALCGTWLGCGDTQGATVDFEDVVRDASRQQRTERRLATLERQLARRRRARRQQETAPEESIPGSARIAGFNALARKLNGEVGATIGAPGSAAISNGGNLTTGSAWSTIKVPLAERVLEDARGPDGLTGTQPAEIERAITASDNAAAAELFRDLGAKHGGVVGAASAVTDVLREAGDEVTEVSTQGRNGFSPYGQTEWSLRSQHQFMAALAGGCVGTPATTRYLLDLMGRITSDRWGLGSTEAPARWKGGWGPGADGRYLVRQMGVLSVDGKQVVITIAARPADGRLASGQAMSTRVAQWLAQRAGRFAESPGRC